MSPTTAFLTMSAYTHTEWFLKLTSVTSVGLKRLPRFIFPLRPSWRDSHSVVGEYILWSLSSLFMSLFF